RRPGPVTVGRFQVTPSSEAVATAARPPSAPGARAATAPGARPAVVPGARPATVAGARATTIPGARPGGGSSTSSSESSTEEQGGSETSLGTSLTMSPPQPCPVRPPAQDAPPWVYWGLREPPVHQRAAPPVDHDVQPQQRALLFREH
ncbi:unnamed protein product, partial [Boreogadus saida]